MERPVLVYTTYPSLVEAEQAGRLLVEKGLAACVNILPGMRSMCRWQGKIENADEVVMIVKTKDAQKDAVASEVKRGHSYDTPAILFLPTEGGEKNYIDWIVSESNGQGISIKV
ncbi:MAG: divalent-cation tolerance protein CutA [Xanthobacteraceae bacterium]|nr:divalent-cation tolerance protein CutA [Xanthobacteraceae bacterium]